MKILRIAFYIIIIALAGSSCALVERSGGFADASPAAHPVTRESVGNCLASSAAAECLDGLFRAMLAAHSTGEALALVDRFSEADPEIRRSCHPVVHAVGRETFRLKGTIHEAFAACDHTCHSGCYHGSVERFLRGEAIYAEAGRHPTQAEIRNKAATACDPKLPGRLLFQCLHGLGHALLYFSRYRLAPALSACDALGEAWGRESCYGGVFMENIVNATPELRDLSPTEYHYPCNKLAEKYRGECYAMQTSRMVEMGLGTDELFRECAAAGAYRLQCSLSIGRDLSNQARLGSAARAARGCEIARGDTRAACVRGVVYALIDNSWDGRYALPFCAALGAAEDQHDCMRESVAYLKYALDKPAGEIAADCARYAASAARCPLE